MPKTAIAVRARNRKTGQHLTADFSWKCPLDHTPNADTIAAIEEGDAILAGKIPAKRFDSLEDFWNDLMS
jgi:hypothetical protein